MSTITDSGHYRLPEGISFEQVGKKLILHLSEEGLTSNMQKDTCAFEGWALCILANNPETYEKVRIDWTPVSDFGGTNDRPSIKHGHYYRFLYRADKFKKNFPDLVEITPSIEEVFNIEEFKSWVLNYPLGEVHESEKTNVNAESHLERRILELMIPCFDYCDEQLPVGLFYKEIGIKTSRTSRGLSQIDLWSVKQGTLTIYELKNDVNVSVGIISELMFYSNVMNDLRLHTFNYPETLVLQTNNYRHCKSLAEDIKKERIRSIEGVLLANNLHPRITPAVLNLMNNNTSGVKYSYTSVDDFIEALSK